jgi:hypothetical protein
VTGREEVKEEVMGQGEVIGKGVRSVRKKSELVRGKKRE